ncbi:CobW family GTP-binding protein [Gibbsiella quercinecans]|uniref:CobW family GTP-binding protein n=1 Tax=Gibbsiella quercinecans TaxID=929813 RepID=UPI003A4D1E8D
MAAMFKIPVHVLSGFLGSGKTTLLRRLLQGQDQRDTALLVNEFGAVGIDHLLLAEVAPDTVLLPSGCVCCAMRGELKQALLALFERRQRGEVPAFSQVILETTGLADPAPIFATLLHDRQLQHHFRQGAMITLVDSEHAWQQAQHQPEWLEQVTAADWLLLSKTDRVAAGALAPLQDYLQQLNPLAHIAPTSALADGDLSLFSGEPDTHAFQRLRPLPTATPQPDGARHPATQTCTIEFDRQINWSAFAVWLSMLLHCHGQSILRIKGILKVAESATPVVIQGVQHSLHPPLHLTAWPPGAQRSQVVLIMRGIDPARVQDAFHRFMLSVAATTPVAPPLTET